MLLKDKVAIVTGAAKGIGYAIVKRFLEEGAKVVAVDISSDLADVMNRLRLQVGDSGDLFFLNADVTDYDQMQAVAERTSILHGRLDIVVNNAAVNIPGDVEELSLDAWDRTMDVNVKSQFIMTKIVAPRMKEQGFGSIINMASANSLVSEKRLAAYVTSKGAIKQFTQATALDLAPFGITVNCIGPGLVNTGFNDAHHDLVDGGRDEVMKHITDIHPIGREVYPEEVADAAVFLGSRMARAITGQLILVDGGFSIK